MEQDKQRGRCYRLGMVGGVEVADYELQRQWQDIKQKYMQPVEEEGGDDDEDE
jgi:hypothetical protein